MADIADDAGVAREPYADRALADRPIEGRAGFSLDAIQAEIVERTRTRMAEGRGGLVSAPTGFGKGVLICQAVADIRAGRMPVSRADGGRPRILMVVPSVDLVGQNLKRLHESGVISDDDYSRVGVLCESRKRPDWPGASGPHKARVSAEAEIVIATQNKVCDLADTAKGRALLQDFDVPLIDEAHRGVADVTGRTLHSLGKPIYGWTATAFREDGRSVVALFGGADAMIRHVTHQEAIDLGRIVPGRVAGAARSEFRELAGEDVVWRLDRAIEQRFAKGGGLDDAGRWAVGELFRPDADVQAQAAASSMVNATVGLWGRYASDRVTLVHAENKDHSRALFYGFAGTEVDGRPVRAAHIVGEEVMTSENGEVQGPFTGVAGARKRHEVLEDMRRGAYDVVTNCQVFREGIDVPAIACSINACQNKGLVGFIQGVAGRGARAGINPKTGEAKTDHLILDLGNSVARAANRDPRFRAGEIDMRGVEATSFDPAFASAMMAGIDGDRAALTEAARGFVADIQARWDSEARRSGGPALPDDPRAEGLEAIRWMNDAGEVDAHGLGDRIFCAENLGPSQARLGSGTVVGVSVRDARGSPESYAVYFDRHGLERVEGASIERIVEARARGDMKREDGVQARWAAAGKLPGSIAEVVHDHLGRTFPAGAPGVGSLRAGSRVYAWSRPNPANPDKVGTGVLMRIDKGRRREAPVATLRRDGGDLCRVSVKQMMPEAMAIDLDLLAPDGQGGRWQLTPGGIENDAENKKLPPSRRVFEPGQGVFAVPKCSRDEALQAVPGSGLRMGGYGVVVDDSRRTPEGEVRGYTVLFEDGRRGECATDKIMPGREARSKRFSERDVERTWDKRLERARAEVAAESARQAAEAGAGGAPGADAPSRADRDEAHNDPGGIRRAGLDIASHARVGAPKTTDLRDLGKGYSERRVEAFLHARETYDPGISERVAGRSAGAGGGTETGGDARRPAVDGAAAAAGATQPTAKRTEASAATLRRHLRCGSNRDVHLRESGPGILLTGVSRRKPDGQGFDNAAGVVMTTERAAALMSGARGVDAADCDENLTGPFIAVAAPSDGGVTARRFFDLDAAADYLAERGAAPRARFEIDYHDAMQRRAPTEPSLKAHGNFMAKSGDMARALGSVSVPESQMDVSTHITLAKAWPRIQRGLAVQSHLHAASDLTVDLHAVAVAPAGEVRGENLTPLLDQLDRRASDAPVYVVARSGTNDQRDLVDALRERGREVRRIDDKDLQHGCGRLARVMSTALADGRMKAVGAESLHQVLSDAVEQGEAARRAPAAARQNARKSTAGNHR